MTSDGQNGKTSLTYRDAGVDIDRGDALVDRDQPFAAPPAAPARMPHWAVSADCST